MKIRALLVIESLIFSIIWGNAFVVEKPADINPHIINTNSVTDLAWEGDAAHYLIYRGDKLIGSTSETNFTDLNPTRESYTVVAKNGFKEGTPTEAVDISNEEVETATPLFSDINDAATYLRKEMKKHSPIISFYFNGDAQNIYDLAVKHTGVSDEGDYLKFQTAWKAITKNGLITYKMSYYSTLAQEKEVDKKVSEILGVLDLNGKSDIEKTKVIQNYVMQNAEYDYRDYGDNNIKRTAYSALIRGTTVCQGYSLAMYRLLLEVGVDTRIVYGVGISDLGIPAVHAWNIVKCMEKYYGLDVTWDDGRTVGFALNGKDFNKRHIGKMEYAEKDFKEKYELADDGIGHSFNLQSAIIGLI